MTYLFGVTTSVSNAFMGESCNDESVPVDVDGVKTLPISSVLEKGHQRVHP